MGSEIIDLLVPQRGYALISKNSGFNRLITHNILSCTALAGIDKSHQIGFLCHFDLKCSTEAFDEIAEYFISKISPDTKFETHIYFGSWLPLGFNPLLTVKGIMRGIQRYPALFYQPTSHGFLGAIGRRSTFVDIKNKEINSFCYHGRKTEPTYRHSLCREFRRMWLTEGSD